jgi:hypothetical protein
MKADDFGYFHAHPSLLIAALFPLKIESVKTKDIESWLSQCELVGLISTYEVNERKYLQIIGFDQRLRRMTSKFPPRADNCPPLADSPPPETKRNEDETETKLETEDEVQNPTSENPKANPDKKTPSSNPVPPSKPVQSNLERFKETVTDQESAVKYLKGLNRVLSIKRILQLAESFNIAHTEEHPVSNYENWKKYFRYFLNNHREPKMPENAQGPAYKPYNPRS